MYDIRDTIVAVSSPPLGERAIVRISGPDTIEKISQIFRPAVSSTTSHLTTGRVIIDDELEIDATLYLFLSPYSYTGETVAEIHLYANPSVTGTLVEHLLNKGLRMAGPGEFTARAYLNNKLDLAQAEAVNEIIVSSNKFQLAAAEKLLGGRLAETTEKIRSKLMDCLTLIEAGLDFSGEYIELETCDKAVCSLSAIKSELEQLLAGSITCESTLDLPAVGIAGAPNAGKSSLLNKLTGCERSIVSEHRKTTRDVLTSLLTLKHCRCVVFDCAGLTTTAENILDELTQQAAIQALINAAAVIFCVDIAKDDWAEDLAVRSHCERSEAIPFLIPLATKCDLIDEQHLSERLSKLKSLFGCDFQPFSAHTGIGWEQLLDTIDKNLIETSLGGDKRGTRDEARETSLIALTARHRQAVTEAIENVGESINELKAGNDEVAAMLLRTAYQNISGIEQQHIDEEILDKIFSRFCIGK